MSLKILYGAPGRYNDVTQIAKNCLLQGGQIKIPVTDTERCKLFTDHLYGVVKHIKVVHPEGYESIYPHGGTADLPILDIVPRHTQWSIQCKVLDLKKLDWIHRNHRLSQDYLQPLHSSYQLMLMKYINPSASVLELGGRVGINTCVLAILLDDSRRLWTIESELKWRAVLQTHKDLGEFKFEIKSDLSGLSGNLGIPSFDTIVTDSGRRFLQTIDQFPHLLDKINCVILTNDFYTQDEKAKASAHLVNHKLIYQENGGWGLFQDCFYEVYTRDPSKIMRVHEPLSYKYYLSVVSPIQNDARFLKEWIEFHLLVGVEHFYLYDNLSTDNTVEVLQPYIQQGIVTYVYWTNPEPGTLRAREHGLQTAKMTSYWVALIDSDEFVVPHRVDDLRPLLYQYESYAALAINWQMFGTSGVEAVPDHKMMVECLIQSSSGDDQLIIENKKYNTHIKSIINSRYTRGLCHQHFAYYTPGRYAVNSNYLVIPDAFSPICTAEVQINHYYYRDLKCLKEIKIDRRNRWLKTQGKTEADMETLQYHLDIDQQLSVMENQSMTRFLEPLRHRIFG